MMEHIVATVRLFDDDTCETQVIAAGARHECVQFAEAYRAPPYHGDKTILAAHLTVRERAEWDTMIAQVEADQKRMFGGKLS